MNLNRKNVLRALASLTVAGVLASGASAAMACQATGTGTTGMMGNAARGGYGGTMMGANGSTMTAAATYLGLSVTDLTTKLHAGASLADVAAQVGKSTTGLKDAMLAAVQTSLNKTTLTAAQKTAMLDRMRTQIDTMITQKHTTTATGTGIGGMMGRYRTTSA